jgi:hypothetical protein
VKVLSPEKFFTLTRSKAQSQIDIHSGVDSRVLASPKLVSAVLSHCWIPADLCRKWFQASRIAEPPDWFDAISPPSELRKSKAGAKPRYDWQDVEGFVFQELDNRGDFEHPDTTDDWKSQNDLIKAVLTYLEKRHGGAGSGPSPTTLKDRIAPMVTTWRAKQSAGN